MDVKVTQNIDFREMEESRSENLFMKSEGDPGVTMDNWTTNWDTSINFKGQHFKTDKVNSKRNECPIAGTSIACLTAFKGRYGMNQLRRY